MSPYGGLLRLAAPRADGYGGFVHRHPVEMIPYDEDLGAFESGLVPGLFGPVISVVSGGVGTLIVVGLIA